MNIKINEYEKEKLLIAIKSRILILGPIEFIINSIWHRDSLVEMRLLQKVQVYLGAKVQGGLLYEEKVAYLTFLKKRHQIEDFDISQDEEGNDWSTFSFTPRAFMNNSMGTICNLWSSTNIDDWRRALRRYWDLVRPGNRSLEKEMDKLDSRDIQALSAKEFYDWLKNKHFRWKYTAPNRYATTIKNFEQYITENKLHQLGEIKNQLFSFDVSDERVGLKLATQIHGLGTAGASGLLALLFPKYFGTVDQFVVKAFRGMPDLPEWRRVKEMNSDHLSINDGVILIKIMKEKADALNHIFNSDEWTPRKMDMILWAYRQQKLKEKKPTDRVV